MLIKRVVGIPGDRLRIAGGQVFVNGVALDEPYAAFEPAPPDPARDNFPAKIYIRPCRSIPSGGARCRASPSDGELVVPPGEYFVLGDNRNHSKDSRFWGFVPRQAIVARPWSSISRSPAPPPPMCNKSIRPQRNRPRMIDSDTNGNFAERLAGFARWRRIFHVVH